MSSRNRSPRIDGSRRKRRSTPPLLENLENRLVLSAILPKAVEAGNRSYCGRQAVDDSVRPFKRRRVVDVRRYRPATRSGPHTE